MAKTKPTSLDGRTQKQSKPAWRPSDSLESNLKPASPPRDNPWHRRPNAAASDPGDSSKPPPPLTAEEFPVLSTPAAIADTEDSEKAHPPPSEDTCKASSTPTDTQSEGTNSSVSRSSTPKKSPLDETSLDYSAEILWRHPVGSNVLLYVERYVFQLHRKILERRSAWFRNKLPPPNKDGSPVEVYLPHAVGAVQPCLFFMYTNTLEICERDTKRPLNFIHIPRCVLAYCAAVNFQIPSMASRILTILEETARNLTTYLNVNYIYNQMDMKTSSSIGMFFLNAVDILYSEQLFELMMPMRHALAGILDALLPSLLRQPYFPEMLNMPSWKRWSAAIAKDQVEYRMAHRSPAESIVPSESELEALFDRVLGQFDRDQAKKWAEEQDASQGRYEEPGEQDEAMKNGVYGKGDADDKDLSEDESTLVCQVPSLACSTGSETSTWNSMGTSAVGRERGGTAITSSSTSDDA